MGDTLDGIDHCCMDHDMCYGEVEKFPCNLPLQKPYVVHYAWRWDDKRKQAYCCEFKTISSVYCTGKLLFNSTSKHNFTVTRVIYRYNFYTSIRRASSIYTFVLEQNVNCQPCYQVFDLWTCHSWLVAAHFSCHLMKSFFSDRYFLFFRSQSFKMKFLPSRTQIVHKFLKWKFSSRMNLKDFL